MNNHKNKFNSSHLKLKKSYKVKKVKLNIKKERKSKKKKNKTRMTILAYKIRMRCKKMSISGIEICIMSLLKYSQFVAKIGRL